MGLLDLQDPQTAGILAAASGLLGASGPSRMPVSLGQAISGGMNQGMGAYRQASNDQLQRTHLNSTLELEKQKMEMMKQQMAAQLRSQQIQDAQLQRQNALTDQIGQVFGGLFKQPEPPKPYQDTITNDQVGGWNKNAPKLNWQGTPEQYFNVVKSVKDPTEQRAMAEAGFRQWPEYRPNMPQATQPNVDPSLQIGMAGALAGLSGLKGGDQLLKFAGMLEPRKIEGGSFRENPITGAREYIPAVDKNVRLDAQGNASLVPGAAAAVGQLAGAQTGAQEAAKSLYDLVETFDPVTRQMVKKPRAAVLQQAGAISAPDPLRTKASEGLNEDWIKRVYPAVNAAGESASGMIANLDALKNINMKTGWGTEAKAAAASILSGLGIGGKNAEMYAANAQKFQSVAMTRLWETLNQAKGPQTEGDANRAKATFAQLSNTPEANDFIVDFARAMANRDRRKAAFYNDAMPAAREAGDLTEVDRTWQKIQGSVWDDPSLARWKR